jgi:hypothetical protein
MSTLLPRQFDWLHWQDTKPLKQLSAAMVGCALVALSGEIVPAQAAQIKYTFGTPESSSLEPAVFPPNVTASPVSFGGINAVTTGVGNPPPSWGIFVFNENSISFTVTPDAGFFLNLNSFSFDERNISDSGPTSFSVFTSVDGFSNSIGGAGLFPNAADFTNHTFSLAAPVYQNLTSPFTIQIVATRTPSSSAATAWLTDNLTLDVDVVPIPTPALLPGLIGMGVAALRRQRSEEADEAGESVET